MAKPSRMEIVTIGEGRPREPSDAWHALRTRRVCSRIFAAAAHAPRVIRAWHPRSCTLLISVWLLYGGSSRALDPIGTALLRFEVTAGPGLLDGPEAGRLFVILGRQEGVEPRVSVGRPGRNATPMLARDI